MQYQKAFQAPRHLATLLVAATTLILAAPQQTASAEDTIKIGGLAPVTGGAASAGTSSKAGWKLAADEINAAGGILGKKVELVVGDTMTDPTHAVSELRRLLENEKILGLVGPATSQEAVAVVGVATAAKLVQVSTAASGQITPSFAPYHFSTSPLGADQMIPNVDFAIDVLKLKKLGLISDNGGMSKAGVADVVAYMKKRGVEPVIVQEFAFRTEDTTPQLFSMRNAGAEAILLINSLPEDSSKLLQNREEIGWNVPVLGSITTTSNGKKISGTVGEAAMAGVYGTQFVGVTYCPGDPVGQSAFAKYAVRARAAVPDIDRIGGPANISQFYTELIVLAAAINGSGKTDGDSIVKWLTSQPSVPTILGPLRATGETHFLPGPETIAVVKTPYKVREDGLYERADCKK